MGMASLRHQIQAALDSDSKLRVVSVEDGKITCMHNSEALRYSTTFNNQHQQYICKEVVSLADLHALKITAGNTSRFFEEFDVEDEFINSDSYCVYVSPGLCEFNKPLLESIAVINSERYRANNNRILLKILEKVCDN